MDRDASLVVMHDFTEIGIFDRSGERVRTLPSAQGFTASRSAFAFAPNDASMPADARDGARIWPLDGSAFSAMKSAGAAPRHGLLSRDGTYVASALEFGVAGGTADDTIVLESSDNPTHADDIRWSCDGSTIITGSHEMLARSGDRSDVSMEFKRRGTR